MKMSIIGKLFIKLSLDNIETNPNAKGVKKRFDDYRRREVIQTKSHYIKELNSHIFVPSNYFHVIARKGIKVDIDKAIAADVQESYNFILGGIYCYNEYMNNIKATPITRQQIVMWAGIYSDSFVEALQYLATHIRNVKVNKGNPTTYKSWNNNIKVS